jgi:hypothetical protein
VVKLENKPSECKEDTVCKLHSKITVGETKFAKERAQVGTSDNHGGIMADEAPSISDRNKG